MNKQTLSWDASPKFLELIRKLEDCGIEVLSERLDASFDSDEYLNQPEQRQIIRLLAVAAARVFHLDTECIYGANDYTKVVDSLVNIADGDLVLSEILSHFDRNTQEAWLSVRHKGKESKRELEVNDDWMDLTIVPFLSKLLDGGKEYCILPLRQDVLIGCFNQQQLQCIQKELGLSFEACSKRFNL